MSVKLSLRYVTNFRPDTSVSNTYKVNNKKNEKIVCKNFIIFIILMRKLVKTSNISFFVKPFYSNALTILRPPYKNKISRHQLCLSRYFINIVIELPLKKIFVFKNLISFFNYLKKLRSFYSFFETNICYQHKSILFFNFKLSDFFKLCNYV